MDKAHHFKIIDCGLDGYVVVNIKGDYDNHTHLDKYGTCKLLIKLVCKKIVPDSDYMRTSAKRISRNKKYIQDIDNKIRKDSNRTRYININKGVK